MGRIRPRFNSRMPKNAGYFFDPSSDDEFKKRHPFGYGVLVFCGITAFILPLVLFILLTNVYPVPNSGWMVLGIVGCFIIGIGLFNIIAAWIKQYLGHKLTVACFSVGGFLVGLSCLLLYNDTLYALFNENIVTYYFMTSGFLLVPGLIYMLFRGSLKSWIKHHVHKATVKEARKGKRNFWWYEGIHAQAGLGWKYHINKAFTIIYGVTLAVHILLGWIKIVTIAVMVGSAVVYVMSACMWLFFSIEENKAYHGTPIVLFARSAKGGIDSVIFDILALIFPLGCGYAQFKLLINIFDISL